MSHTKKLSTLQKQTLYHFFDRAPLLMGIAEIVDGDIVHIFDNAYSRRFFGQDTSGLKSSELGVPETVIERWKKSYEKAEKLKAPQNFRYVVDINGSQREFLALVLYLGKGPSGRSQFSYIVAETPPTLDGDGREAGDPTTIYERHGFLQSSEEKYRLLFDNMSCEVQYWNVERDSSGKILTWSLVDANPPALKTIGRSIQEVRGLTCDEIYGSGTAENYRSIVQKLFEDRRPVTFEAVCPKKNRIVEYSGFAVGDRFFTTGYDITEVKNAEAKLKNSESRFRLFADAIPQLGWVAQTNGSVVWYNKNWYQYTGTTPEEVAGWGWQKVHDPETLPMVMEKWQTSLATGEPFDMEFPLRGADGKFQWFLTRVVPIKDEEGNVVQWFGTNTNIDARKKNQEVLLQSLKARDEFLSIASHELKTPISSLKLQAQLTKRARKLNPDNDYAKENMERLIDLAERQTDQLNRLVDDMLDITRIRAGSLSIHREFVLLCDFLNQALERIRPSFVQNKVELKFVCNQPIEGFFDRYRIEQALINLLTNALRYGQRTPVMVRLDAIDGRPNWIRLIVKDQGMGIAKEDLERIFDRFERAVNPSESSGLGLGLFITRQIAEAHGGRIWAESPGPGQGATFVMELPTKSLDSND